MVDFRLRVKKTLDETSSRRLAAWSQRYGRAVYAYFQRRLPTGAPCEDLVQEVFVRLAGRGGLDDIEQIEGYIFQTAANVLRNHIRRPDRGVFAEPIEDQLEDVAAFSPERILVSKDMAQRLVDAVGAMPERTRRIFVLYHFEHMRHVEIAGRLSIAVRTVEDHIARANLQLAMVLRRDE
jgi:RNA polymerase sigma factor (sigma-70 family)